MSLPFDQMRSDAARAMRAGEDGNHVVGDLGCHILALLAEIDRLRAGLWTSKKPTEPGWYWTRLAPGYGGRIWEPRIVHVHVDARSGCLTEVDRVGQWQWSGPIIEPTAEATP